MAIRTDGITLCALDDIPLNTSKGFSTGAQQAASIFVVRTGHSSIAAFRNSCPHKGYEHASMAWKKDAFLDGSGQFIKCGSHGALFERNTGLCISGPCKGSHLTPVKVEINSHGDLVWYPDSETKRA